VQGLRSWLEDGEIMLRFPTAFELILWSMQTPIQSVMGLVRWKQRGRGVQHTTHPVLLPTFRMYVAIFHFAVCLHGTHKESLYHSILSFFFLVDVTLNYILQVKT
jgi:hypothetical protein